MDVTVIIVLVGLAALGALVLVVLLRHEQAMGRIGQITERARAREAETAERMAGHERELRKLLDESLSRVQKTMHEGIVKSSDRTQATMTEIQKRLAVIDEAQKNISELSTQMVGLQDILANKQARGAFGEVQLHDLVTAVLPASAYAFQATLTNGRRADCLLRLPNPPGPIVIDAKFPLESFNALARAETDADRKAAGRAFAADVARHVNDIAERYIIPGETAESALMFLPSEAVFAELHASFRDAVEQSHRKRVWIVSPSTCMAMLTTVRAVLKDVRMREQAHVIQREVEVLATDVGRLDDRVGNLRKHFGQAEKDLGEIETSARKITSRSEKIAEIEMEDEEPTEITPPQPGAGPKLVSGGGD